tara:strand:- start:31 stop:255 length:225 start_codon:yes stop_codon:yes gene_type:complete
MVDTNLENMWGRIGAVTRDEVRLAVLQDEIEILKSRLEPHDTGHLHTAISVITHRIKQIKNTHYTHEQELTSTT